MSSERTALLDAAQRTVAAWEARFGAFEPHPAAVPDPERLAAAWSDFEVAMADHYPFFHPRFAGQMLKPPHPVAAAGYLAAMLVNPNNHALDGGPGTSALEVEVVAQLAAMFDLPSPSLGHLTSSGTIANLEALWVARELRPGTAVVHGDNAHYTHARMCGVLGVQSRAVACGRDGRIDLDAVEAQLRRGGVGTVVLTAGTTGLGAVDRMDEALALRERYGVRLHVDAAYGGFFATLNDEAPAAFAAIGACDSVVIDPHKHGLQPYGCGAVLFADPRVGRLYRHDSPYTYFTSDELHLGEISLECSRAGAAAAALWLTLRVFPLDAPDGLAAILAAGRRAARDLAARIAADPGGPLTLHVEPELDIVAYHASAPKTLPDLDAATVRMLASGMADADDPVYLSALHVAATHLPELDAQDVDGARILRSVLMKPEHELAVPALHERLVALA